MRQAIILSYFVDQNEPSTPFPHIYDIPDDKEERNAMLKELFFSNVMDISDLEEGEEEDFEIYEPRVGYGDVTCSYGDTVFMYVTFIKEKV